MDIDWPKVNRILVVRLRSIGDTVLLTSSLAALRRFLPNAAIDVLLEDWVAPLLDGSAGINIVPGGKPLGERIRSAWNARWGSYDVVFDQHGNTTASLIASATRAPHRVGYSNYRYSFLFNHLVPSNTSFWGDRELHSAERQLALLGGVGIPVDDRPESWLPINPAAAASLLQKLDAIGFDLEGPFAVIHPISFFETKQWPLDKFAEVIKQLHEIGIRSIAVGARKDLETLNDLRSLCRVPVWTSEAIDLPETTALLRKASLFVGNDSGIAHMAAAVQIPTVVIFGSMNIHHWRPWTSAPNEILYSDLPCHPCPGYECAVYGKPKCILSITPEQVFAAINRVLCSERAP